MARKPEPDKPAEIDLTTVAMPDLLAEVIARLSAGGSFVLAFDQVRNTATQEGGFAIRSGGNPIAAIGLAKLAMLHTAGRVVDIMTDVTDMTDAEADDPGGTGGEDHDD